jgi:hypothetical protein
MKVSLRLFLCLSCVCCACATTSPASAAEGWSLTSGWNKVFNPKPKEVKKQDFQVPTRVVALWSPAMYSAPGKPPTRGFGGRLYFYNQKDQPIPIDGQLVVYGYNDSLQKQDGKQADRKFVFTSAQLSSHFSPAELGASYSIWIPWDGVGGPQLEISLLPVFTSSSGQVVMGEQSRNLLPGAATPPSNAHAEQSTVQPIIIDHRVAPASFSSSPEDLGTGRFSPQSAAGEQSFYTHATPIQPQENIRTTSIQLTRGMAERLIQERQQPSPTPPASNPQYNQQQQFNGPPPGYPNQYPNAYPNQTPPTTTYPLPAQSMPPNLTAAPAVTNLAPQLAAHPGGRSFNAPTADSRAWGPTVQRMQPTQGQPKPGSLPASSLPQGAVPNYSLPGSPQAAGSAGPGQSPTRYAPGSLPVPMTASPLPASGPQPTAQNLAAPGYPPPSPSQYYSSPSAAAGLRSGWSFEK